MARRRSPGGGGGGGTNPMLQMWMQAMLQRRSQQEQHELALTRMREQQGIDTAQSLLPGIKDRSIDTSTLPPEITARLGINPEALRGTDESAMLPAYEQTRQATTQAAVPTIEALLGFAKAKGVNTTPQMGGVVWPKTAENVAEGELPYGNFPVISPPALQQGLDQRTSQLANIDKAQELELDRGFAKSRGDAYNTAMGAGQAKEELFPAELNRSTMEKQNTNVLEQDQARAMIPIEAQAAGANETAQEGARLSPNFVDARVDEYLRSHPPTVGRPTDAQARAGGMFPILMEAHEGLNTFEDNRIDLGFGTQTLSGIPGAVRMLNTDQKALMQYANSYLNVASLILTGVTARPDEYTRYIATYVGSHGDDDRSRMQKRRARELFNESVFKRAQTGQTATGLSEVMDEVEAQLEAEQASYPGEPPPLPDGIPVESDREAIRRLLGR